MNKEVAVENANRIKTSKSILMKCVNHPCEDVNYANIHCRASRNDSQHTTW